MEKRNSRTDNASHFHGAYFGRGEDKRDGSFFLKWKIKKTKKII